MNVVIGDITPGVKSIMELCCNGAGVSDQWWVAKISNHFIFDGI